MSVKIAQPSAVHAVRCDWRPVLAQRVRKHAVARRIVRTWRELTGGGAPTLVACSAGADSTALALALAAATRELTIAHVVHDLRPRSAALADRDAAAALAAALELPFVEAHVRVAAEPGNLEAGARRARYRALGQLATQAGATCVASGHHADDQLETLVMALARGAGLAGLRGVCCSRPLTGDVSLIRPMLTCVNRADARELCAVAGATWREDATNADEERLRAFLRAGPLRALAQRMPAAPMRAARAAELVADAAGLIEDRAREVFGEGLHWRRESLQRERRVVLAEGLRQAVSSLTGGAKLDRLSGRILDDACAMIRDGAGNERRLTLPNSIELRVGRNTVSLSRVDTPCATSSNNS